MLNLPKLQLDIDEVLHSASFFDVHYAYRILLIFLDISVELYPYVLVHPP